MSLRRKLIYGICAVFLGGLLSIGYGFLGSKAIRHIVTRTVTVTYPSLDAAIRLQALVDESRKTILNAIELEDPSLLKNLDDSGKLFADLVNDLLEHGRQQELETIHSSYRAYTENAVSIVNRFVSDGVDAILEDMPRVAEGASALQENIEAFRRNKEKALNEDLLSISDAARNFARVFLTYGIGFSAVMILVLIVGNRITRLIGRITGIAQDVAGGHLDKAYASVEALGARIQGLSPKDETARLFHAIRTMTENLNSLISEVQKSGVHINASASGIAGSARDLESMVGQQAASTKEVTAAATLISTTSQELVRTMGDLSDVATHAGTQADDGRRALDKMKSTMQKLMEANDAITARLAAISEKTTQINVVMTTISKVADQTNLLSLNASIEAEKAGEYGLGFAVVAREIRRLADQTGIAALEIERMVQDMLGTVSVGLKEIQQFTQNVQGATGEVGNVSERLEAIIAQIEDLPPSFKQVSGGVQTQAQRAQDISESMVQLNSAAQSTSENLRAFSNGTALLHEASERLEQEISRFKVGSESKS